MKVVTRDGGFSDVTITGSKDDTERAKAMVETAVSSRPGWYSNVKGPVLFPVKSLVKV